ncbi:MAG: hypothetical protein IJC61_06080 [Oscillospiraceae bacterium]|nr:hypothetical protein [Oscillospiraceae bacterium]
MILLFLFFIFFAPIFLPFIYVFGVIGRLIWLAVQERREAREREDEF